MRSPQLTSVARALRALVEEIKTDRGEVEEYLIVDDVLERLTRYAAELEATDRAELATRPDPSGDPS